jgi:hypothetical protein
MIQRYDIPGEPEEADDGNWCWYVNHLSEVKAAVKRERERILAAIGTRYPDQYSREMDRAIREIEIIVRERGKE